MEVKIVAAVDNLNYDLEGKIPVGNDIFLSNDKQSLNKHFFRQDFIESVGAILFGHLLESPFVIWEGDINKLSLNHGGNTPGEILDNCRGVTQSFLFGLWFIKDNCVNIGDMCLDLGQGRIFTNRLNVWFSDASGQYNTVEFSKDEIKQALEWQEKILDFLDRRDEESRKDTSYNTGNMEYRNNNMRTPYGGMNRFSRTFRFIHVARSESFLPAKITSYISALESLLSTSTSELKAQVSERAAKLIGGDLQTKLGNYNIIREAYDARSAYVHGSTLGKKYRKDMGKLIELSQNLDNVLRELMQHMVTNKTDLASASNEELTKWVRENLIF